MDPIEARNDGADAASVGHHTAELTRTPGGKVGWRIRVYAIDNTPAALDAAVEQACAVDDRLFEQYGERSGKRSPKRGKRPTTPQPADWEA